MKSFGIGAAAALLAAWAMPAPAPRPLDELGRRFESPRRATGFFEWEGNLPTACGEHETFAFVEMSGLR